jgi:prevent-host-death family protein
MHGCPERWPGSIVIRERSALSAVAMTTLSPILNGSTGDAIAIVLEKVDDFLKQPASCSIKKGAKMMRGDMIDISQDIHSLTTFKRETAALIKRMKKSGRPLVLTVKGRAEAVVMDAASFQRLWDRVDATEGIRRGLIQAAKGMGRPLEEVLGAIEKNR